MVALTTRDEMKALAEKAGEELEGASALEILGWADEQFGPSWAVASSMADTVMPSLAAKVRPGVDVLFLDTGYHFAETIGTRDAVAQVYDVNVRTMLPLLSRMLNRCEHLRHSSSAGQTSPEASSFWQKP